MHKHPKNILSNKILHYLKMQCIYANNAMDCTFLIYLCITHKIPFNQDTTTSYITKISSKSNIYRHRILQNKLTQNNTLAPIDINFALEISHLLDALISINTYTLYTLIAIRQPEHIRLEKSRQFIETCVTSTRTCILIADNIISSYDEVFTPHKIKRLKNMHANAKDAFFKVHTEYASSITELYSKYITKNKNPVIFHGWENICKSLFKAFTQAFLILNRVTTTLK